MELKSMNILFFALLLSLSYCLRPGCVIIYEHCNYAGTFLFNFYRKKNASLLK